METAKSTVALLLFGGLSVFLFVAPLSILLFSMLSRVPKQHRVLPLGTLWFLAVPLVQMVYLYFAVTRVSQSFQNCLAARGARPQGDCGYQLGQALVLAVWGMAAAPTIAFLLELGEANVAIVGAGLTVFAMFSAYAVRIFGAARAR